MGTKTKAQLDREIHAALASPRRGVAISRQRARPTPAPASALIARAGAYHALGQEGDPWPQWLIDLKTTPGAYLIRDAATHRPLYAGSAKNNLYSTITRHFQQWRRQKKWWKGQYGAGHDPGLVYDRGKHEVAIWVTTEGERLERETQLIGKFHPRDNLVEHPDGEEELEEAPF